MKLGILSIQVEDRSDSFNKFSLLQDHDINYITPSKIQLTNNTIQGVKNLDEREYRECKSRKTS